MKVIDLLNKIANGEINEDIKIEYQYGLSYEYCTIREFFDRYIVDKENLNQEIILEDTPKEDKKIEHINKVYDLTDFRKDYPKVAELLKDLSIKQYEIIDKINGGKDEKLIHNN